MKTRLGIMTLVVLALAVTISGCVGGGGPVTPKLQWSLVPNHYYWQDSLELFPPENIIDGYRFLVVNVSLHNTSKEEKHLIGSSEFFFIAEGGNSYEVISQFFTPDDRLPTVYPPQDYRTGNLYFQVPANADVTAGKLMFTPFLSGQSIVVKLINLPHK